MFWKLTALSALSPVDGVLDKESFTLEELLDEEEIIQECKALNSRLINFLRDRAQVEQLLRYLIEEPPEGSDSKRVFKFPFVSCEIFTCEIDVILRTLVEEEELMDLLFSFLEPTHRHSTLLAGYFSKVVMCLMMRKMVPLVNYVQDILTSRVIGSGREQGGLYRLLQSPFAGSTSIGSSSSSAYTWHLRFGHLPLQKLLHVLPQLSSQSSFQCESC